MVHEDGLVEMTADKEDEKIAQGLYDTGCAAEERCSQGDADSGQQAATAGRPGGQKNDEYQVEIRCKDGRHAKVREKT